MHVFIVNPGASRGRARRRLVELEAAVRALEIDYRMAVTRRPGHATELAREAVKQGARAVVAAGGDGTIHEVLNGLDDHTPLGIVPIGTCDDIVHNLGYRRRDWRGGLERVAAGRVVRVDCGRCDGRRFLSVAGAGLDSRVARVYQRLPRPLRGWSTYAGLVVAYLVTRRPSDFRLVLDGQPRQLRAWLVAVANTGCYAGGMQIAPGARPHDGRLHVCIVGATARRDILRNLPRVYTGAHMTHPHFHCLQAETVEIASDPPHPVIADGEIVGRLPMSFAIEPAAVTLLG